jgi:DNA-binding NarL/FixJ family response regulator
VQRHRAHPFDRSDADDDSAAGSAQRRQCGVRTVHLAEEVVDGIEATRRLARANPSTRILILTTYDLDEYVYEAMRAGASGFLLKDVPPPELVRAVRTVVAGDALLAPTITRRLLEEFVRRPRPGTAAPLAALTERERDVLRLLAKGLSNAEIANRLFLGEATVKTHVARVLAKLHLRDRVQAVVFAYESGMVQPGNG